MLLTQKQFHLKRIRGLNQKSKSILNPPSVSLKFEDFSPLFRPIFLPSHCALADIIRANVGPCVILSPLSLVGNSQIFHQFHNSDQKRLEFGVHNSSMTPRSEAKTNSKECVFNYFAKLRNDTELSLQ